MSEFAFKCLYRMAWFVIWPLIVAHITILMIIVWPMIPFYQGFEIKGGKLTLTRERQADV